MCGKVEREPQTLVLGVGTQLLTGDFARICRAPKRQVMRELMFSSSCRIAKNAQLQKVPVTTWPGSSQELPGLQPGEQICHLLDSDRLLKVVRHEGAPCVHQNVQFSSQVSGLFGFGTSQCD